MNRRRIRFEHLIPARNIRTESSAGLLSVAHAKKGQVKVVMPTMQVARKPRDMGPRDWAVYLLHNAALVEHALMVQYLYALFSLDASTSGPDASDPTVTADVSPWIASIRAIAIEEMGHLLTVQNLLRFVGGPIRFDREDFPIPTDVYPFPFQLERLTKDALAKYVFAEMPADPVDPASFDPPFTAAERTEIEIRARKAAGEGGDFANHVGILYATLLDVFSDPAFKDPGSSGFPPATDTEAATFQATANVGWHNMRGNNSIVETPGHPVRLVGPRLLSVNSLDDVLAALSFIARQGEASDRESMANSHFGRFLKIYRSFPEDGAAGWARSPSFNVATNPITMENSNAPGAINHPATQLWARLFDLRYRMLLVSLAHATAIPNVAAAGDTVPTEETTAIVDWMFNVMTRHPLSVGDLAMLLPGMPQKAPVDAARAGAPFTMPYTTVIPDRRRERWQLHLDLLDSMESLVVEIQKIPPDPQFPSFADAAGKLDNLRENNGQWRNQVIAFRDRP